MKKAKFLTKYLIKDYGKFVGYELVYEYRGRKYSVYDMINGCAPLSWQHTSAQRCIDASIEREEKNAEKEKKMEAEGIHFPSVDEVLTEFLAWCDE